MTKAPGICFVVNDIPYAVWEWDLHDRNIEFIRGIEHNYFEYVALSHLENLEGADRNLAALAIRTAYFHGLETLLTLACAAIQAPYCIPAWIQRCRTEQLRTIVDAISSGHWTAYNPFRLQPVSWLTLAELSLNFSDTTGEELNDLRKEFADLWGRVSRDWLEQASVDEYNSIKHGLRVSQGGFYLKAGIEQEYCVPPPSEEMKLIGGSNFGSKFFQAEAVMNASDNSKTHFRIKRHNTNWNPESLAKKLALISMSIANIKGFLRVKNGDAPEDVKVFRPNDIASFWEPWNESLGIISASMDTVISEENIERITQDEILQRLYIRKAKKK
ncbi:MAG: hypothetical protein WD767_02185 [Alphaproteobacteria bacterium]